MASKDIWIFLRQILSALKLLGFYELWSRSDESSHPNPFKAWSSHVTGNAAFILLRDPSAFIEGHAHRLFADSRYGQVDSISACKDRNF
ncbi:hypothetical protein V2G26_004413 [Clonostachys chloroleuca]